MKEKNKLKVVVGFSGGVDSSVAAFLLKKQGYEVIGAFMKNFSDTKNPITGECNWVDEYEMAKKVAVKLEIPLVMFDFEKEYKSLVIKRMIKEYKQGLTPNPDTLCNSKIKFPIFWKKAKELGADFIAMGHYARIKKEGKEFSLLAGKDKIRDQSYFLCELNQKDLSHTLFPIGNLTKEEVRKIAKSNNLPNWDKKGTRGICFVGKVNLKTFLEREIPNKLGRILNENSEQIGVHPGISYFTIGQRLGERLGVKINNGYSNKSFYVAQKKGNDIIAVEESSKLLLQKTVRILDLNIINPVKNGLKLKARIRHLGELHSGKLKISKKGYSFDFDNPVKAIAPGQAIALYKGNNLLAGGEIRLK